MTINIDHEAGEELDLPYEEIIQDIVLATLDYEGCPYEAEVNIVLTNYRCPVLPHAGIWTAL